MYLPSFPNLISEIEAIISVKKDLEPGASCSSNLHPIEISNEFSGPQGTFQYEGYEEKTIFFKTRSTYNLAWESHNADCRKSIRRMDPFELLYANILQWVGWNSADVITSTEAQGKFRIQSLKL